MADQEEFPLLQGQPPAQAAPPPQQDQAGLAQRWNNWMASPQNRAALIQFGVALSQPIPAGQNVGGQIGSAIGSAGEASDRVTAQEMRQQELESKQELRSAQAAAQEARAGAAGARTGAAIQALDFKQQQLEGLNQRARLNALVRIQMGYSNYINNVRKENKNRSIIGQPLIPELSQQDWMASNPDLVQMMSPSGGMAPTGGATGGPVQVNSPEEAQSLPAGTPYITPDGRKFTR